MVVFITTTTMTNEVYESLGLSPNEAKIYESLVEHGESGISQIAVNAKIHRRNAYDAISRLIDKGLCFEIISNKENKYNAVDPDKLVELLAEKQNALQKVLPNLKKKFNHRLAPQEAYIYKGIEGQKNIWRDLLSVGEDSYFVGAKGGWFDQRLDAVRPSFFKEAKRKNIKFVQIYDHEIKGDRPDFAPAQIEARFLPKEFSTSSAIHIFGEYVVTYTGMSTNKLEDDVTFFIIRSKELADSYKKWFKFMWEKAEK
jgi:sugar-specific transcriptional regulator TrmB